MNANASRSYLLGAASGVTYSATRYGSLWEISDNYGNSYGSRYASLRAARAIAACDLL